MDDDRLNWIERWLQGWSNYFKAVTPESPYAEMPLYVAVGMALELLEEVKRLRA